MDTIELGIIGMGRMGITHYSIINSHPSVKITSIAEPSGMILSMVNKYIPGIATFKSYEKLIEKARPHALLICTPPDSHYEISLMALEKGIHVFAEKPFTTNLRESKDLAEKFTAKNLVNQVGYVNRFNDVFLKVKELVDEGIIGKVIRFRSEMFSGTITSSDEGSGWRASRSTGGGATFEMASHAIDLVNFIIGIPDKIIGTTLNSVYSKNVEDIVSTTFLYKNDIAGSLYVNWSDESYRKPTNKLEIFGTKGKILADQHSFKIFVKEDMPIYGYHKGWNTIYITDIFKQFPFYVRGNEFTRQLYHFIDCISEKENSNNCSFTDAADTHKVIDQMFSDFEINTLK